MRRKELVKIAFLASFLLIFSWSNAQEKHSIIPKSQFLVSSGLSFGKNVKINPESSLFEARDTKSFVFGIGYGHSISKSASILLQTKIGYKGTRFEQKGITDGILGSAVNTNIKFISIAPSIQKNIRLSKKYQFSFQIGTEIFWFYNSPSEGSYSIIILGDTARIITDNYYKFYEEFQEFAVVSIALQAGIGIVKVFKNTNYLSLNLLFHYAGKVGYSEFSYFNSEGDNLKGTIDYVTQYPSLEVRYGFNLKKKVKKTIQWIDK